MNKSLNTFILPTLVLLIVVQISYVLAAPSPTTDSNPSTVTANSALKNSLDKPEPSKLRLLLLQDENVEVESDSPLRQKRNPYGYGGYGGYGGGRYGGYGGYGGGGYGGYGGYGGGGYGGGYGGHGYGHHGGYGYGR